MSSFDPLPLAELEKFNGNGGPEGDKSDGPSEDEKMGDGMKLGKPAEVGNGRGEDIGMFVGDARGDPDKGSIR